MRRFLFVLAFFSLLPAPLAAQSSPSAGAGGRIVGRVAKAVDGAPLTGARVAVRSAADSSVVGTAVTGADGHFSIGDLEPGRYRVEASSLGYARHRGRVLSVGAGESVDVGTLSLSAAVITLKGITAEGERSTVISAPDRTIYSTADMPVASGGVATEVLQGVPELEVDIDGNVSLRGTAAQIYINGRPAPMQGEALQIFLQNLPADRIDRVEVIPNPSAKFESEGAGGIVNIVLKDDVDLGLGGSVFLNGGSRGEGGGGGRLSYQKGPLTLMGGGYGRLSRRKETDSDIRANLLADPITYLQQEGWSRRSGASGSMNFMGRMEVSETGSFWARMRARHRGSDRSALTDYLLTDASESTLSHYSRSSTGDDGRNSADVRVGYDAVRSPHREEWSVELRYSRDWGDGFSRIDRTPLTPEGDPADEPVQFTTEDTGERNNEYTWRSDVTRPWGEDGLVELGYRGQLRDDHDDRLLQIFADGQVHELQSSTDRGFEHRELFNAAYLTLTRKFGPLGVQAGIRAERADTRLELPSTGDVFDNDYLSVFPSANVRYDLGGGQEVRLSYSKRIRRPWPGILNPINTSTDPLNRNVGNPDIDPQYTRSLSVDWSWTGQTGTLRFSPYYRHTIDDWTRIKKVDEEGVSTVTWENLASVDAYGTSFTASMRPVHGVNGFVSVSGYREVRDASNLTYDYSGASMRWTTHANLTARLTPALSVQGMAYYTPAREVAQGRISSTLMTHFGLRQELLDGKASLRLAVTDPFDVYHYSFTTSDPTHRQTGRSHRSIRSVRLSFSYSFGHPPRNSERPDQGQQDQMPTEPGIR